MLRENLTLLPQYVRYFATQFVRGPKYGATGSFHMIATNSSDQAPGVPSARFVSQLFDRFWYGSAVQRTLNRAVGDR